MKKILLILSVIFFLIILLILIMENVSADKPSKIELNYDYDAQILNVTITHSVGNPNNHYIFLVEITKNSESPAKNNYNSQPNDYQWTYSYDIIAENGDELKAQAFCNEEGDTAGTITVEHINKTMALFVKPDINLIDENSTIEFTLAIESDSDPVDGVDLKILAVLGNISEIEEVGEGDYNFDYQAPELVKDEIDTINISASKRGYSQTNFEFKLNIHNVQENATKINITLSNEIQKIFEKSTHNITVIVEAEGNHLEDCIINTYPKYGEVMNIIEIGTGEYEFEYFSPEVNGDVEEEILLSISKEGYETAYKDIIFTVINEFESESKICIFLTPDTGNIEQNSSVNFTVTLEALCEPLEGVSIELSHTFSAVTNVVDSGEGKYLFTYLASTGNVGDPEIITVSASKEGYKSNEQNFDFTIIKSKSSGGNENQTNNSSDGGNGNQKDNNSYDNKSSLDGIISLGEYEFDTSFGNGDFKLYWNIENDTISFAMVGRTTGWVSLGLDPGKAMEDSDMIIGWVDDQGVVHVVDAYSTGPTGPHPPDIDLGGTNDVIEFGGSEQNGTTIIEFKRKLNTTDQYDKEIPMTGNMKIIWSNGPSDGFNNKHEQNQVGTGMITFDTGESTEENDLELWPIHAFFMTIGLFSMFIGVHIAKFKRKENWWMKFHKILGLIGSVFTIIGLIIGLYMVEDSTGEHFRVNHSFIGVFTILFALLTPILGILMFKFIKKIKILKIIHRWFGRTTIILMIFTVISGLKVAGVI